MALDASLESAISTNPNPLDLPENLSVTTAALSTFPTREKSASRSSLVVEYARLPMYSLGIFALLFDLPGGLQTEKPAWIGALVRDPLPRVNQLTVTKRAL
jgi:hypothetical protein